MLRVLPVCTLLGEFEYILLLLKHEIEPADGQCLLSVEQQLVLDVLFYLFLLLFLFSLRDVGGIVLYRDLPFDARPSLGFVIILVLLGGFVD